MNWTGSNTEQTKMQLVPNRPFSTQPIAQLVSDKEDLQLLWPGGCWPFNHAAWRNVLDPHLGSVSLLFADGDRNRGHMALVVSDVPGVYSVCFVFLEPELRGLGFGKRMLTQGEDFARRSLGAERLTLKVRTYNPVAERCYRAIGFREAARDGTIIHMTKDLSPASDGRNGITA